MPEQTGTIRIRLFDGAREPYSGNASVLVRVRDRTRELASKSIAGSTVRLTLPVVDEIEKLQAVGAVAEEQDPAHWHPGVPGRVKPATRSWKQVRFDVSNVQFTFHEQDTKTCKDADGRSVECVVVEPDMDLYRDLGAHGLLEVVPNLLTGNKTNALDIYRLRWMATRQEGVQPDFAPPVTVA